MKLSVLQGENFTCQSCTNCCRNWHVELMPGEIEQISQLPWPQRDPLWGASVLMRHAGKTFIAHRPDATCIFLNLENGRCRIHEQFGMERKPLGCRLFPFQIRRTFAGEASAMARYDCPSVRRNVGEPHAAALPELRRLAARLEDQGFDEQLFCGLERDQVEAVSEFITTMMAGFARDEERAMFLWLIGQWLAETPPQELDRAALAQALAPIRQLVNSSVTVPVRPPGMMQRYAFRSLLGQYLRRDEDVLDRRAGRAGRALAMGAFVMGRGSFRSLGLAHPAGKVRRARLFKGGAQPSRDDTFALLWRLVRGKLESFQFMGSGNSGRNVIDGLRSLALLYPLVRAAAKYSAASRGANEIEPADADYAVAAIEHSFGRLPILNTPHTRSLENLLLHGKTFLLLVRTV